ncbi:MAG: glycosyltransferase family 2 protein [Thermomicrobiales bacterium]|nr:glycosyltransferase family 2 protein [Thermomicrobiales bacterium]
MSERGFGDRPLVSVVMTTRDRPEFLATALRCFAHQTYPNRELIVVDDGDEHPVDPAAIAALGGKLVTAATGAPIGTKLNLGLEQASGYLCQKMDDDDWYGPAYIQTFVDAFDQSWRIACRPTCAVVTPFLFFHVAAWEVRRSADGNVPGATLFFRRQDWKEAPFRDLPADEDLWFYQDHLRLGGMPLPITNPDIFMAVRHRGSRRNRGHTWVNQWNNISLEQFLEDRPIHKRPEKLLPKWALEFYRGIRQELLTAATET